MTRSLAWSWPRKFFSNSSPFTDKPIDSNASTILYKIRLELNLSSRLTFQAPNQSMQDAKIRFELEITN